MKRLVLPVLVAAISMMSPPVIAEESNKFQITIMWPGDSDADVDVRIKAPDEPSVIDFRKKQGSYIRLLRDELGSAAGVPRPPVYFEMAMTDARRPGEYVVNVKAYRGKAVTVTVLVDRINAFGSALRVLHATTLLSKMGQERTIASFIVDDNGDIEQGSAKQTFRQLDADDLGFSQAGPNVWTR